MHARQAFYWLSYIPSIRDPGSVSNLTCFVCVVCRHACTPTCVCLCVDQRLTGVFLDCSPLCTLRQEACSRAVYLSHLFSKCFTQWSPLSLEIKTFQLLYFQIPTWEISNAMTMSQRLKQEHPKHFCPKHFKGCLTFISRSQYIFLNFLELWPSEFVTMVLSQFILRESKLL